MSFDPNKHLLNLKGKDYLQVMWRLVWFREEKPQWCIDTQHIEITDDHAIFCCKIMDENGIQKCAGYGSESKRDFGDFIEKAETKAVGRALAMLGYGTQFSPELDEGERIVDSPVQRQQNTFPSNSGGKPLILCEDCTSVITFTPDGKGGKLSPDEVARRTKEKYGKVLCVKCAKEHEAVTP